MSPTESALLLNPFQEETKEYSFPLSFDQAVAETTSGIHKRRITEPIYQETGLDWLEKSVDWLMDTPFGDALAINGACALFLQNPSYLVTNSIKGMLIDGKSGEEVMQELLEHSKGIYSSLIKGLPEQFYYSMTFPDMIEAELEEIANISQCTNQTGGERVLFTVREYINRKVDLIGNGIMGTIHAYRNGDARTKGEIEGKILFAVAEIVVTKQLVSKPMIPVGMDDIDDVARGKGIVSKGNSAVDDVVEGGYAQSSERVAYQGGSNSVKLAISSQGNEVYTGIDDWIPIHLKKGEIYYRGEPKGTEFFTTKESIQSVDSYKKQLFEGIQVREDPVYGYRKEMQGYRLNSDLNAAQAKCLKNMQFGKGGLEQKYIPDANELISSGILEPVDKIILK